MAIDANIVKYNREIYELSTELLNEKVNIFNAATNNGFMIGATNENKGSYTSRAFWGIASTVRRRNAAASTAISDLTMAMKEEATVKVAAGTPRLVYTPGDMQWFKNPPNSALVAMAKQKAVAMFADMVTIGLKAFVAATVAQATNYLTVVAVTGTGGLTTPQTLADAKYKLGDAAGRVVAIVMNAATYRAYMGNNMTNQAGLFVWNNVAVRADVEGTPIIVTDLLLNANPSPVQYHTLFLCEGGIVVEQNTDEFANATLPLLGTENLGVAYQEQWSYNLGLKGYTWDKTNGGISPTDAALTTATNWDKVRADYKDLAGVVLRSNLVAV